MANSRNCSQCKVYALVSYKAPYEQYSFLPNLRARWNNSVLSIVDAAWNHSDIASIHTKLYKILSYLMTYCGVIGSTVGEEVLGGILEIAMRSHLAPVDDERRIGHESRCKSWEDRPLIEDPYVQVAAY